VADQLSAVFSALVDPNRRAIVTGLAERELLDERRFASGVAHLRHRTVRP
jgi:hypothetical protein